MEISGAELLVVPPPDIHEDVGLPALIEVQGEDFVSLGPQGLSHAARAREQVQGTEGL